MKNSHAHLRIFNFSAVQSVNAGLDLACGIQCKFLWDGFGNWVSGQQGSLTWKPFMGTDGKWRTGAEFDIRQYISIRKDEGRDTE